jgi:hypothetical protein
MKSKMTALLTTLLAVALTAGQAMSAEVCGVATDAQGNPIAGAAVTIKDASGAVIGQATTGANGSYSVGGLPDGNMNLFLATGSGGGSGVLDLTGRSEMVNWQTGASGAVASQAGPCNEPAGGFTTAEWASVGVLALGVGAGVAAIVWAETGNRDDHHHAMSPSF